MNSQNHRKQTPNYHLNNQIHYKIYKVVKKEITILSSVFLLLSAVSKPK